MDALRSGINSKRRVRTVMFLHESSIKNGGSDDDFKSNS
jgi:hypothetical protein